MEKLRGGAKNLENKHVASGRKHVVRVCTRCSASRCTFGVIAEKWLHRIFLKFCHGRADDVCGRLQNYRKIYGADFPQYVILCWRGVGGRPPPGRTRVVAPRVSLWTMCVRDGEEGMGVRGKGGAWPPSPAPACEFELCAVCCTVQYSSVQ